MWRCGTRGPMNSSRRGFLGMLLAIPFAGCKSLLGMPKRTGLPLLIADKRYTAYDEGLTFQGAPLLLNSYVPIGSMYFINQELMR